MKKFLIASTSAVALMGLAACSDTDETTTQSIDEPVTEQPMDAAPEGGTAPAPEAAPTDPVEEEAPATDDTTTQSIDEPVEDEAAPADEEEAVPSDEPAMEEETQPAQ